MSRLKHLVRVPISFVGFPWRTTATLVRGRVFTILYRYLYIWLGVFFRWVADFKRPRAWRCRTRARPCPEESRDATGQCDGISHLFDLLFHSLVTLTWSHHVVLCTLRCVAVCFWTKRNTNKSWKLGTHTQVKLQSKNRQDRDCRIELADLGVKIPLETSILPPAWSVTQKTSKIDLYRGIQYPGPINHIFPTTLFLIPWQIDLIPGPQKTNYRTHTLSHYARPAGGNFPRWLKIPRLIFVHVCCGVQTSGLAALRTLGRAGKGWCVQSFFISLSDRREGKKLWLTRTGRKYRNKGGGHTRSQSGGWLDRSSNLIRLYM